MSKIYYKNLEEWKKAGKPINSIVCCDCIEGLKELPDNYVDLVLTDPPYNTGMSKKESNCPTRLGNFFNDSLKEEDYQKLVNESCQEFYRILKENRAIYAYMNWKELGRWINKMKENKFNIKNVIVWDKVVHGLNYQNYAYTYELIIFGIKGKFKLNNKTIKDLRKKYYTDVWKIQRKIENDKFSEHETKKHIEVISIPILHSTIHNDLVLDPFLGSGTTAVACKRLNRNFLGFEINPDYCKLAVKRLEQENIQNWIK